MAAAPGHLDLVESIDRSGHSAFGTSTVVLRCDSLQVVPHPERAAMGSDLFVGRFGLEGRETSLATHLAGLGLKVDLQRLFEADEEVAMLCFLNGASIVAFLEHVGVVEGYPDRHAALRAFEHGDSRLKNM